MSIKPSETQPPTETFKVALEQLTPAQRESFYRAMEGLNSNLAPAVLKLITGEPPAKKE